MNKLVYLALIYGAAALKIEGAEQQLTPEMPSFDYLETMEEETIPDDIQDDQLEDIEYENMDDDAFAQLDEMNEEELDEKA